MKVIAFVMFFITLFTVAYSVPTNLNPQSVKSRDLSTTLAQEPEWTDQAAYFTINLGHVKQILKQYTEATYNNGETWKPNPQFLPATASPSQVLCIRPWGGSTPGRAAADVLASVNLCPGNAGYETSSLLWVYTVPAIDSLANSVYFKIRALRDENARLRYELDKTKTNFEEMVKKSFKDLNSGVFLESLREQDVKELSKKLQPLVEAEVSKRVKLLQSDPAFIKNIALAVKKLKP